MQTPHARFLGALFVSSLYLFATVLFLPPVRSHAAGTQASAATIPAYGNCAPPQSAGIHICQPLIFNSAAQGGTPLQLIATATGSRGPVSNVQVWVDGVKVAQASGNVLDAPAPLSQGTHQLTVVEVDSTGEFLKSAPASLLIEEDSSHEACPPPVGPGVNVCVPFQGACHTAAWSTIVASATAANGSVRRMELWSDGVKLANFPGNTINTNVFIPDFSNVTVVEIDSAGGFLKSSPIVVQSC